MSQSYVEKIARRLEEQSGFEKTAFLPEMLRNFGKSTWNLAMGGRTLPASTVKGVTSPARWEPLHGLKNIGMVHETHADGPLKGMLKYDPKTGDPVKKGRGLLSYVAQEFKGPKPTRADLYAHHHAGKMGVSDDMFEEYLKGKGLSYKRNGKGVTPDAQVKRPRGVNVGEFMERASPEQLKEMGDVNQMGALEFIKKHPALAANWYGRNALHKGLFVGYPAYELGGVLTGDKPLDPEAGVGANVGQSLGSTVGMVAGLPLGLVGGTAGSMALAEGGKRVGAKVDRLFNNRPMGQKLQPPAAPVSPASWADYQAPTA